MKWEENMEQVFKQLKLREREVLYIRNQNLLPREISIMTSVNTSLLTYVKTLSNLFCNILLLVPCFQDTFLPAFANFSFFKPKHLSDKYSVIYLSRKKILNLRSSREKNLIF